MTSAETDGPPFQGPLPNVRLARGLRAPRALRFDAAEGSEGQVDLDSQGLGGAWVTIEWRETGSSDDSQVVLTALSEENGRTRVTSLLGEMQAPSVFAWTGRLPGSIVALRVSESSRAAPLAVESMTIRCRSRASLLATAFVKRPVVAGRAVFWRCLRKRTRARDLLARALRQRFACRPLPSDGAPIILVLSHEMSRTGAPLLGWNLIRHLARHYRVVSVAMGPGDLERDFKGVAAASIGPLELEDRHPVKARRKAQRLVEAYRPLYAVANSIEARALVPHLVRMGVPTVALIHEFAAYTRPLGEMRQIFDHASHVVFPAQTVALSSFQAFPELRQRAGIHVRAQGCVDLPASPTTAADSGKFGPRDILANLEGSFVVLGAGVFHIRKGVDLFISAAAAAKRMRPRARFRFIWLGDGFDPVGDVHYSAYLAEQIAHSDLGDSLSIVGSVSNLEPFYARADAFLMTSRLDPQPNVGIDAVTRGIPTICFEGACGTAEILAADPDTRRLVVPHLDAHEAANEICRLVDEGPAVHVLREAVSRVGLQAYRFDDYVAFLDSLGRQAVAAIDAEDLETLVSSGAVDPTMLLLPGEAMSPPELERTALLRWRHWGQSDGTVATPLFRRPCAGFHPQLYARAHPADCAEGGRDPLAHWIRSGRSSGPWSRRVYGPDLVPKQRQESRIALHCHCYYPELAKDLLARVRRNDARVDLYVSTDSETKANELRKIFDGHRDRVEIGVFPNRGRDLGPFLSGFAEPLLRGEYDVVGHMHAKRSLAAGAAVGEVWRGFLWDNLIGGKHAMLDAAIAAFAADPRLGLLMAEDPHLVGWNENRRIAETLAGRMGLSSPLDDAFDFPLGTMFWARPVALRPLLELHLDWDDYPAEPLPYDGTLLHALERLLPFVTRHTGYEVAGIRAPGTSW